MDFVIEKLEQGNRLKTDYRNTDKLCGKNTAVFTPQIDARLAGIQRGLSTFDLTESCVWSSACFNEFTVHQIPRSFTFVEVEKEAAEAVFYHLRDAGYKDVFLLLTKTDEIALDRYIFGADNPIIIQKIVSKSPTQKIFDALNNINITVPRLEKILVDLYCEDNLFRAYKGTEQYHIFENALKTYPINLKTLLAYAQRRKKDVALRAYLNQYFQTELEQNLK